MQQLLQLASEPNGFLLCVCSNDLLAQFLDFLGKWRSGTHGQERGFSVTKRTVGYTTVDTLALWFIPEPGSAKLSGLDPEVYLREVMTRIADHPIIRIKDLLPWNINPTHAELST
jgi:hypothetical protein